METPSIRSVDIETDKGRVLTASVPLDLNIVNVLTQTRRRLIIEETNELAESILVRGQQVPGRVVALKPRAAGQYLQEINILFGVRHKLRAMNKVVLDGQLYYLFVIYGHRRLAACQHAWSLIQAGDRTSDCFSGEYVCDIYFDLTLDDVISLQLIENQHVAVPKHEEIAAMWRYWCYLKRDGRHITVASFAARIGRRPSYVRDMLRFSALPDEVQKRIDPSLGKAAASYSLLVQVARLVEAYQQVSRPFGEAEIIGLVDLLIVRQVPANVFAKEVSERIAQLQGEQADLFGNPTVSIREVRKIAAENLIRAVMIHLHYINAINTMMRNGSFGDLSPYQESTGVAAYSPHSPARMMVRMCEALMSAVPDLAHIVEQDGSSRRRLDKSLRDAGIALAVFDSIIAAN